MATVLLQAWGLVLGKVFYITAAHLFYEAFLYTMSLDLVFTMYGRFCLYMCDEQTQADFADLFRKISTEISFFLLKIPKSSVETPTSQHNVFNGIKNKNT